MPKRLYQRKDAPKAKKQRVTKSKRRNVTLDGPDPTDVTVGHHVRLARLAIGKSQTWLGDQVGLTFGQIQKYEYGANRIGASNLLKFAKVFGKDPNWFFDAEPSPVVSDRAYVKLVASLEKVHPDIRPAAIKAMNALALVIAA